MAAKPIAMEQLKQVLQLSRQGVAIKAIARITGLARNTVKTYLARGTGDDIGPGTHNDAELAALMFNNDLPHFKTERYRQLSVYLEGADRELLKPGVTRQLLWREYLERHPNGYGYSQFCHHLQQVLHKKDVTMHLEYVPAEQIMVDFAGKKYPYTDPESGEMFYCEVFVATLPYSGLVFCMAVSSQKTADFLEACNRMLYYVGGSTQTVLCDNLRTAVKRSDRYEPVFTDLCYQLSDHYGTTFSATRPARPRDKAMVEASVKEVYRTVYAPLRYKVFHSIEEINHHFHRQLEHLNTRPYKGSSFSRRDIFQKYETSLLTPLPTEPLQLKKGIELTVQRNYHIQLREDGHYYSIPWQHVGKKVKVWYDQKTVEVYLDHQRIAFHVRSATGQAYHTIEAHMPSSHQEARSRKGWTKEELLEKASRLGPSTKQVAEKILATSIYMEQNYKSCFGMLMLEKRYGKQRVEAACALALTGTRTNYTMIKNILQAGMDKQSQQTLFTPLPGHDNIRGASHYQ